MASGLISVLFERVDLVLEAEAASATTVLFFEVLGSLAGGAGVALAVVPPGEGTCCVEGWRPRFFKGGVSGFVATGGVVEPCQSKVINEKTQGYLRM